ncbi:MAG: hypothetical protein ACHQIG_01760 [Acidimicrobiia bacterium]
MTIAIIGILLLAWVAFLAPTLLRARNNQVRADSVGDFHHRLRALAGSGGHRKLGGPRTTTQPILGPMRVAPGTMSPSQRRRRDVLLVLAGFAGLTFLAAVATRSTAVIAIQLLADAALVGYVYLLIQHKQRTHAVRGVHLLPDRPAAPMYSPYPSPAYGFADIDLRARALPEPRLVPLRASASG